MQNKFISKYFSITEKYKTKKIFFIGIMAELIYLAFFSIEPLKKIYGDNNLVLQNNLIFLLVIFILLVQMALYIIAGRKINDDNNIKKIFSFSCLFIITLIFIWPVASIDFFSYIYRARIFSHFQANPYFINYQSLASDQFYYLINNVWSSFTSLYGPLINLFNSALTFLSGNNFILTFLLFKIANALFSLANGLLIYKITDSAKSVLLYLWNPFILFELIVNGHNEVIIIFFILLSIYLLKINKKRLFFYSLSLLALFFTVLVKVYTLVLVPIFVLIQLKYLPNIKQKIYFIISSLLAISLFSYIFYFPFWQGVDTLTRPIVHANNNYGSIIFSSIIIIALTTIFYLAGFANYTKLGYLFGRFLFVFFYIALIYEIIKNKQKKNIHEEIIKYLMICLIIFYLAFFNWFMPWYFTILITLIILYYKINKKPLAEYAIYGLSLFGIIYYFVLR